VELVEPTAGLDAGVGRILDRIGVLGRTAGGVETVTSSLGRFVQLVTTNHGGGGTDTSTTRRVGETVSGNRRERRVEICRWVTGHGHILSLEEGGIDHFDQRH